MRYNVNPFEWRGTTLVEILVVITISAILFLAVFDGMDLAKRCIIDLSGRLLSVNSLSDNYRRMDYLLGTSDRVEVQGDCLSLYRNGKIYAVLEKRDSLVVQLLEERTDTLFQSVERWCLTYCNDSSPDSLRVYLYAGKKTLELPFGIGNRNAGKAVGMILEQEKIYEYEE